ncbi:MAG: DUF4433 domain-containing protein [Acetobacter sp.]|nr:DUF4433 domain-containing protein [Acetobacter sp.]MBO6091660.1 DUF4433 domain-containing protein [Acetobacter sp.]
MSIPNQQKIYHIVHVNNLKSISDDCFIFSYSEIQNRQSFVSIIGIEDIKQRRLSLPVLCNPDTYVGEYVPFNFCPRSVMLYIIHKGNTPNLTYKDGQDPIIHLQADLHTVLQWAEKNSIQWAFSSLNAGTRYAQFYNEIQDFEALNWEAIETTDFRDQTIKYAKQAEFLIYHAFPFELVEKIGVYSEEIAKQVNAIIKPMNSCPKVEICKAWYF